MNSKISVIIPVYNASEYIEECVKSVLMQDYPGYIKVIVVDNESTDITLEHLDQRLFAFSILSNIPWPFRSLELHQVPNIFKYSWHEPTRFGLDCIEDSEYFMFMAADDVLEPEFLSNSMRIIEKAPDKIKALQSPVKFFGKWNHIQKHQYKNLEEFKEQMLERSVVNTPTIVWHRSFYDEGLMDLARPDKYFGADDYALYCELATRGHFIFPAPKYLGYNYRIHEDNASWGMHSELNSVQTIDKEIQEHYRKIWKEEP